MTVNQVYVEHFAGRATGESNELGTSYLTNGQSLYDVVAVPERGLLLQKEGTLILHPSINMMTAVIKLQKLDILGLDPAESMERVMCLDILQQVKSNFHVTLEKYRKITKAVFQDEDILCYHCKNKTSNSRQKRVAGLAVGIAAMGVASFAVSKEKW